MRKSYRCLATWLIAVLFSVAANAQVTISGSVHNSSSKEAVPSVSVTVKGTDNGTYTNPDGSFSLKVAKLPVVLVFSSSGYASQESTVNNASDKIDISFVAHFQMGEEVVVAANRTPQRILESPVTIERMGPATLRNLAAPNAYEAIANLKGVDMHTASLTFRTPTTRGFVASGNFRLNQLIDGMDNQAPGLNFSVGNIVGLTELDVDNIELLSGASSALYGSGGMNGTILMTSKNPFKYQGLSFNVKQGIMHVDGYERRPAPYYDWSARWAKAIGNKIAIKLAFELVKANDWQAQDYRNKQQIGVLSQVVGGNRSNDPNFNGVNVYGDETSANMLLFSNFFRSSIQVNPLSAAFAGAASGGTSTNIVAVTNSILGNNPSAAALGGYFTNLNNFLNSPQVLAITTAQQRSDYLAAMQGFVPINLGLNNNIIPNQSVSRTGYEEKYLVDYNTLDFKFTGGLHWKITNGIEASWNTYWGTGTTVYTGADRYSLRNLKIAQHKLEFKHKNWFLRGYTTQENAGESYNASALGGYLNEAWKPSSSWFAQYIATFSEGRRANGGAVSDIQLHSAARAAADVGRLIPGTQAFDDAVTNIRNTPISKAGALFLDKSDLWAGEGQLNVSDAFGFSNMVEVLAGASWKQWIMNSRGTIFADTTGRIKVNEYGGSVQLKKRLFDDALTLTASGRWDKQTNFKGRFTPRFTAVGRIAKDNYLRVSYQTAYRFPTNQDQYISLTTGAGSLIGCLPDFMTYYKLISPSAFSAPGPYALNGPLPGYTPASILAARAAGSTTPLVVGSFKPVVPETVSSTEIGYKGVIGKIFLVDAYYYFSSYKNFLARAGVGQSKTGNPAEVLSPFTTTNVSFIQNSDQTVKARGWGIGLEYQFMKNYFLYGNVYSDELKDVPAGLVTFFNAPKYRWNLGLRNDNVCHNFGFNVVVKWQDNNFYEGTFVTGTLPYFTWVDAQVTYRPPNTKSTFRLGGTNIGNNYYRTGFGSPEVGGLYYFSYGYNIF